MKTNYTRPVVRAMAFSLLLVAIGLSWYFTRPHFGPPRGSDESTTISTFRTKTSKRSAPDPAQARRRQESIALAAQKWYEQLLEKYPQMKPTFRDVPDEKNGFLQFLLLAESVKEPKLPEDLSDMLGSGSAWDPEKFKTWLAENKDYRDQILHIAELPDQSIKGLDLGRLAHCSRLGSEFGNILSGSARLAFEAGDQESALRYSKASIDLSNHFTGIEVPSMLGEVIAAGFRVKARDSFLENILPGLSDDPQTLASWRDALFRKEAPASEYARVLFGEWNTLARANVLPALLEKHLTADYSFQISDADAFFEQYTSATQKLAASFSDSGPERLDLSHSQFEFPDPGIDPKTLRLLHDTAFSYRGIFNALGVQATRAAMISAALAVQLGEEPAVDPVSGKPFQWDPQSRTLASPEGVEGPYSFKLR